MPVAPPLVIVLASGRGERFSASGGKVHKLAALLAGKPVLQHTVDAVHASGLGLHLESGPHAGMGDSIAAAVRATRERAGSGGWLILPGDLPLVLPATLGLLAATLAGGPDVIVPTVRGQRGHPVAFGACCHAELAALTGDTGARSVVARHDAALLATDDEGCVTDVDTLEALSRAEALLAERRSGLRQAAGAAAGKGIDAN